MTGNYALIEGNSRKNLSLLDCPPPLSERRARIKLTTLHKAINGHIEIPLEDLINANANTNIVTRSNTHTFLAPHSRVDSHLYSFYPDTIRLWNNLPQHIKSCETTTGFKLSLEKQTLRATYK